MVLFERYVGDSIYTLQLHNKMLVNIWKVQTILCLYKGEKCPKYWFSFASCQGKQGLPGLPGLQGEPVSILALKPWHSMSCPPFCHCFFYHLAISFTLRICLPKQKRQTDKHQQAAMERNKEKSRIFTQTISNQISELISGKRQIWALYARNGGRDSICSPHLLW